MYPVHFGTELNTYIFMAHDTICHAPFSVTVTRDICASICIYLMRNVTALIRSQFLGWQAPCIAQPAHPQDDFPFLLPRTIMTIIATTARTKTALMMIVAIFSTSHVSIEIPPTHAVTFFVSFVASLYGLNSI